MTAPTRPTLSRKLPPGTSAKPPRQALKPLNTSTAGRTNRVLPQMPQRARPIKPRSPRQMAREMALQAIYHEIMNPDSIELIIAQIVREQKRSWADDQLKLAHPFAANTATTATTEHESTPMLHLQKKPMEYAGALLQSAETARTPPAPAHGLAVNPLPPQTVKSSAHTPPPRADRPFFRTLTLGVLTHRATIETQITPSLDRSMPEVSPMVRAILILGAYELAMQPITPVQVILNEAVELAKRFASDEAYRYVNGVLEKFAFSVRAEEMQSVK